MLRRHILSAAPPEDPYDEIKDRIFQWHHVFGLVLIIGTGRKKEQCKSHRFKENIDRQYFKLLTQLFWDLNYLSIVFSRLELDLLKHHLVFPKEYEVFKF